MDDGNEKRQTRRICWDDDDDCDGVWQEDTVPARKSMNVVDVLSRLDILGTYDLTGNNVFSLAKNDVSANLPPATKSNASTVPFLKWTSSPEDSCTTTDSVILLSNSSQSPPNPATRPPSATLQRQVGASASLNSSRQAADRSEAGTANWLSPERLSSKIGIAKWLESGSADHSSLLAWPGVFGAAAAGSLRQHDSPILAKLQEKGPPKTLCKNLPKFNAGEQTPFGRERPKLLNTPNAIAMRQAIEAEIILEANTHRSNSESELAHASFSSSRRSSIGSLTERERGRLERDRAREVESISLPLSLSLSLSERAHSSHAAAERLSPCDCSSSSSRRGNAQEGGGNGSALGVLSASLEEKRRSLSASFEEERAALSVTPRTPALSARNWRGEACEDQLLQEKEKRGASSALPLPQLADTGTPLLTLAGISFASSSPSSSPGQLFLTPVATPAHRKRQSTGPSDALHAMRNERNETHDDSGAPVSCANVDVDGINKQVTRLSQHLMRSGCLSAGHKNTAKACASRPVALCRDMGATKSTNTGWQYDLNQRLSGLLQKNPIADLVQQRGQKTSG